VQSEQIAENAGESSSEPEGNVIALPLANRETIETESAPQFLYIIAEDDLGPCKIGISNNVDLRLTALQTGNPRRLTVFGRMECGDATALEEIAHEALEEFRLSGEWFDVPTQRVEDVINMLAWGRIFKTCENCNACHTTKYVCDGSRERRASSYGLAQLAERMIDWWTRYREVA
jgi:hypothetical protein